MKMYALNEQDKIEHWEYISEDERDEHIEHMIVNGYSHIMNHGETVDLICASYEKEESV